MSYLIIQINDYRIEKERERRKESFDFFFLKVKQCVCRQPLFVSRSIKNSPIYLNKKERIISKLDNSFNYLFKDGYLFFLFFSCNISTFSNCIIYFLFFSNIFECEKKCDTILIIIYLTQLNISFLSSTSIRYKLHKNVRTYDTTIAQQFEYKKIRR